MNRSCAVSTKELYSRITKLEATLREQAKEIAGLRRKINHVPPRDLLYPPGPRQETATEISGREMSKAERLSRGETEELSRKDQGRIGETINSISRSMARRIACQRPEIADKVLSLAGIPNEINDAVNSMAFTEEDKARISDGL